MTGRPEQAPHVASDRHLTLDLLPGRLAIARLPPDADTPEWARGGPLVATTRTDDELSIVCTEARVPTEVTAERGLRALRVRGPLEFTLTGVLASLAAPLAAAEIAIFAVSTYDTDYLLVRDADIEAAVRSLVDAGHIIQV